MEMVSDFSGHWLEIIAAVYLIGMVLYGHYKGFIRLSVSALALVITLITVRIAMPYAADWLKNETPVYETVKNGMEKAVGLDELLAGQEEKTEAPAKEYEDYNRTMIEGLKLPEQLKRYLEESNDGEVYQMMGAEALGNYVGSYLADTIINIIVFIVLFLLVFILLHVAVIWLDLIAKLPILSGMNQIAGAVLGGAEAVVFLWIGCLVFTALSGTEFGAAVMGQINSSPWLSWIYDHNMLSYFVIGLIRGAL